ncbi:MAG TPA: ComEC/Rec2 family competence protein, partial [bacterium]|nr:ComEC/Rec2 family competence protein [bacterium]
MLFAYMYIIGVALGYLFPQPQGYTRWYLLATGLLGLAWGAVTLLRRRGARLSPKFFYVTMCLFAMSFGVTRYNQDFSVPDEVLARVTVTPAQTQLLPEKALTEIHRLRVQKLAEQQGDVVLTFAGMRDSASVAAQVTIPAADKVGASYMVDEPFTELKAVTAAATGNAEFVIYAVSNHLSAFASDNPKADPYEVEGIINIDPDLYDNKAKIQLDVTAIRPLGADYFFPVSGGALQASIKDLHPLYEEITQLESYGWKVKMRGVLLSPMPLANPGGFDFKRYLNNSGMFAVMNLQPPREGEPASLEIVERSEGSPIVELSLFIKDRMLRVFKQTVPYPESAFLGGMTLGMRYGLSNAMTPFNGDHLTLPDWAKSVLPEKVQHILTAGTNLTIPNEFQWAGINHVLAVSGLHVSIITIMFWGIFTILKVPPKIYAPIMVLALLIFAIITGYRPSTQRAALMNSIAVLSTTYMGKGLRAGILFTIPFSGLLVLLFQPLLVVEPSLTLSYFAVLALGLLTTPCQRMLARLRGWTFVTFLATLAVWTTIASLHWPLVVSTEFWLPFVILFVLAMYGATKLNARHPTFTYGYSDIPLWFSGFFAAQFGIQFGMMIPLSSFYFGRWPLAGCYANFIAIPLIGIIVQLAMIAGILAIILPWFNIGTYMALLLNATNFFLCKLFVAVGHYSVLVFSYPYVSKFTPSMVFFFFGIIACFIWHQSLLVRFRSWALAAKADPRFRVRFYGLCGAGALCVSGKCSAGDG